MFKPPQSQFDPLCLFLSHFPSLPLSLLSMLGVYEYPHCETFSLSVHTALLRTGMPERWGKRALYLSEPEHTLTYTQNRTMLLMVNHLHTQKDVYIFPSSAPGLFIHCCIRVNVIPYTLKMTRTYFGIHDWLVIWILCMRTHIHTDKQRMSHAEMKRQSFQNEPSDPFFMSRIPFSFIRLWQISFSIKSI